MRRAGRIGGIGGALIIVLGAPAWGSDPPDSRVNPVSGRVETTDSYLGAVGYDVRHVEDQGPGQGRLLTVLSLHEGPDLGPRIGISDSGVTWVCWWRDGTSPAVLARRRDPAGSWGPEMLLGAEGEASRGPVIAVAGPTAWVAWEVPGPGRTEIAVRQVQDAPDPMGRRLIGGTPRTGPVDLGIQAESGHVWATWAGEGTTLAWSQRDPESGTWSAPESEPAADGTAAAWQRVRARVLGL